MEKKKRKNNKRVENVRKFISMSFLYAIIILMTTYVDVVLLFYIREYIIYLLKKKLGSLSD